MIKTDELTWAAFEAETDNERWLCRHLALSIADRSPYAWHLYYGGEADKVLSEKSLKALEIVMDRANKYERKLQARKRLIFEGTSAPESPKPKKKVTFAALPEKDVRTESLKKKKGVLKGSSSNPKPISGGSRLRRSRMGVRIEPEEDMAEYMKEAEEEALRKEVNYFPTPIVCALFSPEYYHDVVNTGKGKVVVEVEGSGEKIKVKEKIGEVPMGEMCGKVVCTAVVKGEVVSDDENQDLEVVAAEGGSDDLPVYVEDEEGNLKLFRMETVLDPDAEAKEIPMSPCSSGEWDPKTHCFAIVRKGSYFDP